MNNYILRRYLRWDNVSDRLDKKEGRRMVMEAIVLENERIGKGGQKAKMKDVAKDSSLSWWRIFPELLKMSFNGPFVCQWEKMTDLPWREGW